MADQADVVLEDETIKLLRTGNSPVVDIEGGHWNLAKSDGDLRIGDDENMLKMGVSTGGGGAGNGRIWATSDLRLGSRGESIVTISEEGLHPVGDNKSLGGWQDGTFENLSANFASVTRLNPQYDQDKDYGVEKAHFKDAYVSEELLITGSINSDLVPAIEGHDLGSSETPWDTLFVKNNPNLSDRRLKTNIENLEGGLDTVLNLRPVSYRWRDNGDEIHLGLIGQEVADVLPEVVNTPEDDNGYLGVDYTELVAVLVDAIQNQHAEKEELQTRVERQEERIEDQQVQIEDQQARLEDLEERLAALE